MHQHRNGLKTALLLAGMFAVLLAIGGAVAAGTGRAVWILMRGNCAGCWATNSCTSATGTS